MSNRRRVATTHFVGLVPALFLLVSFRPLDAAEFYNDWATNHLSGFPTQSGPTNDPDSDGTVNLAEYAFGTDPLVSDGLGSAIVALPLETNGVYRVEIFERAGHRPGVQIDLDASADLTNWFRPWWLRTTTNSLPGDPTNSVRELFTTYITDTNIFIVRGVIKLFDAGETANYYVATNGDNSYPGTSTNQPFATLAKAVSAVTTGQLIYVRGGTYAVGAKISLSNTTGTATSPIRIRAYPGETPTLDGSSFSSDVISISGNYYQLYGLVITNAGHNSISISGNNNTVERCVSYGARNTGIAISGGSTYPATNLVLNCDSTRSYNAPAGEDADGFSAKNSLGTSNVFRGCRSWENSDDGWDLYAGTAPVLMDTCWTWRNGICFTNCGSFTGDGNGFKLGGVDGSGNQVPAAHRLVNCLAFNNPHNGIDQNNNSAGLTVDQSTLVNSGNKNFYLTHGSVTAGVHVVRNNISFGGGPADTFASGSILISNSWQVLSSPPGTNDFLSMDSSWALAPRRDDGGLPETPFMRPIPGDRLVDQGTTNIGAAFNGSAPDLGAFETPAW